jgi:hypothetical protein
MPSQNVSVTVHEKEFEVTLVEKDGKVFAKTHINNFGEVQVPDFGGGRDRALENIKARIGNILAALENDEARVTRKREAAQAAASPAQEAQTPPAAAPPEETAEAEGTAEPGVVPPPDQPELN